MGNNPEQEQLLLNHSQNTRRGGLKTIPFIIVNESCERLASFGLQPNMIIYLTTFYHMEAAPASVLINLWSALSNGLSIFGAFISDSYLGRFKAVAIGTISSLIGMFVLWLTTIIPQLRPLPFDQYQYGCNGTTAVQLVVFVCSLGLISIGAGFVRPCSIAFGADQLENKENPDNDRVMDSYFNWFYASVGVSIALAVTVIVYIQDHLGWQVGFGVPALLMLLSVSVFLIGSPLYIKAKPKGSLFTGVFQVAVAAIRRRHIDVQLNYNNDRYYKTPESNLLEPSADFTYRFKSEVPEVFWKFKALVENQSGCKMKMLRSYNGTEYTSDWFETFCKNAGIEHQLTVPYTPQQNDVSKRKNRTIMEMSRCLLYEKGLPKKLWAEAANTTIFLLNRLPTKAVEGKTPFEAWHRYKPSLKNKFYCLCFAHIPQVKRDKLDKKAEPGVFIGYITISKAYRVFQPDTGKIIVSRDVFFMENEQWDWEEVNQKQIPRNLPDFDEDIDNQPVRGTQLLSDIYQRCNVAILEPSGFEEAVLDPKWQAAMEEELEMIEKNKTWQLVEKPQDRKIIGVKWVYCTKLNVDGSVNKLKARLVVKGYSQIFGVDYSETFATVARLDTIRLLLAVASQKGNNLEVIEEFKKEMKKAFEMTDLGEMSYFLGMQIHQTENEVFVCQKKYAREITRKFKMEDCKRMNTPMNQKEKLIKDDGSNKVDEASYRSVIGCLMYLTATRPDILQAVSVLSRFLNCSNETHMKAAKK